MPKPDSNGQAAIAEAIDAVKAEQPVSAPEPPNEAPVVPSVPIDDIRARLGRAGQLLAQPMACSEVVAELVTALADLQARNQQALRVISETDQYLQAKAAELAPSAPGAVPGSLQARPEI